MAYTKEIENLIENLHLVAEKRQEFAHHIQNVVQIIQKAEIEGQNKSGKLFLDREVQDLEIIAENLKNGRFRLMVIGDMNHGKSTILNVLLGKPLLPSAVNPCTAILTIIRFGEEEKVTVYFKDNHEGGLWDQEMAQCNDQEVTRHDPERIGFAVRTETMSFEQFKQEYTIDPQEAKRLEEENQEAFPDVSHAIVEYPLELLRNGVEMVDSPGLNDTHERNQLTLGYINNCHAVLFVLNATKPCTMDERRYLENYLKDKGLTIFFLINRWDELQKSAFDPDDAIEVKKHEDTQRLVFATNLQDYCTIEGSNLYQERVFETSALNALRRQVKGESIEGTGIAEFLTSLKQFLTKERAISEFRRSRTVLRDTYIRLREAIDRRVPLLAMELEQLQQAIKSVEPDFNCLQQIRNQFQQDILKTKEKTADDLAQSAYLFFSQLDKTFEEDFRPYVPPLNFFKFLWGGKRKEFERKINEGFKKYVNDKMAQWGKSAEKDLRLNVDSLTIKITQYGFEYQEIVNKINADLTGITINTSTSIDEKGDATKMPGWARFAAGATSLLLGDVVGVTGAATGTYNWRMLLGSIGLVIGVNVLLTVLFGLVLGPLGMSIILSLAGLGQTEGLRKEFLKKTKELIKKELPQVAKNAGQVVEKEVFKLFKEYQQECISRIDDDIKARKSELETLLTQKEKSEFEREMEIKRLNQVERDVFNQLQMFESMYDDLLNK
ncbi:dynamin family protein [Geminocystis sp. GBBB08]|uniref:dynamin family protein n=1 Tax=Geminocystis sp. GBBB08 TaxID=2604140 RepID=UPI0027E3A67F|nr:dynamin family protein [Geminocystis sp. GBBB08]MBL1208232.1 dynamin [Geminocystis sp. GBBB08]